METEEKVEKEADDRGGGTTGAGKLVIRAVISETIKISLSLKNVLKTLAVKLSDNTFNLPVAECNSLRIEPHLDLGLTAESLMA